MLATAELGRSGVHVTRLGFGAWALPGGDADGLIAAITRAVEAGVNWIDTGPAYGYGETERVVGRALARFSDTDRPMIFTKCGMVWDESAPSGVPRRIGAPDSIRREVEGSLRRLGVERLDLCQPQWPARDGTPVERTWQALLDLRDEGKVRLPALSNHDTGQLTAAERIGHVEAAQLPLSVLSRRVAGDELAWCARAGTGVLAYSVLENGLLSGRWDASRVAELPRWDFRRRLPAFTGELSANLQVVAALDAVARRHEVQVWTVATAWTLAWPGVAGAIVGARRPDQQSAPAGSAEASRRRDALATVADLRLDERDLDEIDAAIAAAGAGTGPGRPQRQPTV